MFGGIEDQLSREGDVPPIALQSVAVRLTNHRDERSHDYGRMPKRHCQNLPQ